MVWATLLFEGFDDSFEEYEMHVQTTQATKM